MALISIIENFKPMNDERLLQRAEQLIPHLYYHEVKPVGRLISSKTDADNAMNEEQKDEGLGRGDYVCFDFGNHYVGQISLEFDSLGSHPDAPAFIKLNFAETIEELNKKTEDYNGWVSSSWIQEEFIHIDDLPSQIELPRRYAFRFLRITVLDTSPKYRLVIRDARCRAVTSADYNRLGSFSTGDASLDRIYDVSLRTLAECMQKEFEDGPKRDRRLWLGDLRLQSLTNYVSFRNYDLVKRCLYLFGGSRFPDGRLSACIFTSSEAEADDTYLFDYALFFVIALEEYLAETEDEEALNDLYEIAMEQIELSVIECHDYIVQAKAASDCFIDWCDELDRRACAQAVLIYAIRYACRLAERRNDIQRCQRLDETVSSLCEAARNEYWNQEKSCFVSNGQISLASQVWMILADVTTQDEAESLMSRSEEFMKCCPMTTPYMHHYYVMALLHAGLRTKAIEHIKGYWGGMIDAGADTFWEAWNPEDMDASPYGDSIINSYCHAWSCTPAYLLKHFKLYE